MKTGFNFPDLTNVVQVSDEELSGSVDNFLTSWNPKDDLFLFCYGSLLWRPETYTSYIGKAVLEGMRRDFCVWSVVHRGTFERPGLVLGLIPDGFCEGGIVKIEKNNLAENLLYLWKREMFTNVYQPLTVEVLYGDKTVKALTFVVDRTHPQFSRDLTQTEKFAVIENACGKSGKNVDYVKNTLVVLRDMGIDEPFLDCYANLK